MNVAEDIVIQILLKLAVRSLLRFRCVCKDWCALITSSFFKDTYLAIRRAMAVDDQVVGLRLKYCGSGIDKRFVTCWYDDYRTLALSSGPSSSSNDLEIWCRNCSGNCFSGPPATIVSHYNGLVCIRGGDRNRDRENNWREDWLDITLVNPALRQVRKLPVPDFGLADFEFCDLSIVGFGYDDATNDYKVFASVLVFAATAFAGELEEIGLVYHLSTNSWIKLGLLSEISSGRSFWISPFSTFSHGSIHWIMTVDQGHNRRILSFNLTSELFQEMLFPLNWSSYYYYNKTRLNIFTIDESTIALAASIYEEVPRVLDIWVMKEYGVSESWTKQYSISPLPKFSPQLSCWKKDKLLIITLDYQLICYDLLTGQVYDPIGQQNKRGQLPWGLHFVTGHESFVSVSLKQV